MCILCKSKTCSWCLYEHLCLTLRTSPSQPNNLKRLCDPALCWYIGFYYFLISQRFRVYVGRKCNTFSEIVDIQSLTYSNFWYFFNVKLVILHFEIENTPNIFTLYFNFFNIFHIWVLVKSVFLVNDFELKTYFFCIFVMIVFDS